MKTLVENRFALLGLVLVALAALFGVAEISRPRAARPAVTAAGHLPVVSRVTVCPDPGGSHSAPAQVVTVTVSGGGRVEQRVLGETKGDPRVSVTQAPTAVVTRYPDRSAPAVVGVQGTLAGGTQAMQVGDAPLAATRCTEPGTDMWFLGPGAAEGSDPQVLLTNVDDGIATVNVEVYAEGGQISPDPGQGALVVQPRGQLVYSLRRLTRAAKVVAVRVRAVSGRVAAAVWVGSGRGGDWLPPAAPPAKTVVVPGVPPGGGRRELIIAVPGPDDATVNMQVVSSDGSYAPGGRPSVDVGGETVISLPLDTRGKPAGVTLSADVPISAGVIAEAGSDIAYTAGVPPLAGRGIAAGGSSARQAAVLVSAPDPARPVTVELVTVSAGGTGAPQTVQVPAGQSRLVPVATPPGGGAGFGITVTPAPGSGPAYVARLLQRGAAGLSIEPVVATPDQVSVPPAVESLSAALPRR